MSRSCNGELLSLANNSARWRNRILIAGVLLATYVLSRLLVQNDVVHPFILLLGVLIIDQFAAGEDSLDRLLVVVAAIFGLLPVLGWIHEADVIGPIEMVVSVWFTSSCVRLVTCRDWRPRISVLPAVISAGFTYWWWRPVSLGTPTAVLSRILPQWDNSTHFLFFYTNLVNRQYLIKTTALEGVHKTIGRDYPSGIHYVWSTFAASRRTLLAVTPSKAVPVFAHSVTLTLAVSIGVAVVAIARIATTRRQKLTFGIIAAGISMGLMSFGPLSQTISSGFANLPAVVVGVLVVVSLGVKPLQNKWLQLIAILGGTFSVLYNWYPVVLVLIPILFVTLINLIRTERWYLTTGLVLLAVCAGGLPVLQTFTLGISHLAVEGGITSFPKELGLVILLGAFIIGFYFLASKKYGMYGTSLMLPFVLNLALAICLRIVTGEYPYYFEKFFLITSVITGLLLVMALLFLQVSPGGSHDASSFLNSRGSIGFAFLLAICLANFSGYIGPDRSAFAKDSLAIGVSSRDEIVSRSWNYEPTMNLLLRTADEISREPLMKKSCYTLFVPDRIGAKGDGEQLPWKELLGNVWFHGLTNSYTVEAYNNSYSAPMMTPYLSNEDGLVVAIDASFPKDTVCPVSSSKVSSGLKRLNSQWRTLAIQTK